MSAFLAPIHYWLYNKIRGVIEREQFIFKAAENLCGGTAEEARSQAWQSYGEPLPEADLQEQIDHSNIHGWLQRQINVAESREAAFIQALVDNCGDAAIDVAQTAFREHGVHAARHADAQGKYETSTAPGIYKAINDYYLNGMPCDQADAVLENTPDKMVWENAGCLQEPNWKRVGADSKIMQKLYNEWLAAFVNILNPGFAFNQTADTHAGAKSNRYEIVRV
ncbi:hypothetical protein [Sporomusa sp. KB1]|jgi:hypothetical protein|uniref:hypothetical protein n=1 Tax=Sporomusa sp. KB1 TaxID=943346 RepID=UPI0011A03F90|nr:hypothetical protein [Sporomusa sp. KB1]TWH46918.1 hypothetical protein Salpa_2941 [Sporomusa sp. KB1]